MWGVCALRMARGPWRSPSRKQQMKSTGWASSQGRFLDLLKRADSSRKVLVKHLDFICGSDLEQLPGPM